MSETRALTKEEHAAMAELCTSPRRNDAMDTVSIDTLSQWLLREEGINRRFVQQASKPKDKHHAEGRASAFEEIRFYLLGLSKEKEE